MVALAFTVDQVPDTGTPYSSIMRALIARLYDLNGAIVTVSVISDDNDQEVPSFQLPRANVIDKGQTKAGLPGRSFRVEWAVMIRVLLEKGSMSASRAALDLLEKAIMYRITNSLPIGDAFNAEMISSSRHSEGEPSKLSYLDMDFVLTYIDRQSVAV